MILSVSAFCLSFHAGWRCRHSGACCRAGWAIPVESDRFERITRQVSRERAARLFITGGPLPEGAAAILGTEPDGACRFHEGQRCAIHRDLGQDALPSACQQFPRIALVDGRGTFVRLSHFCPTAASLLLQSDTFTIVRAPDTIALQGNVEGLDARAVLPPLLRPGLLTDLAGYGAWESGGVETLASGVWTAGEALGVIDAATRTILDWGPGDESLEMTVRHAFTSAQPLAAPVDPELDLQRFARGAASIPDGLRAPRVPRGIEAVWTRTGAELQARDAAARAWLASHLFGNWTAYSANGLSTVVEYLHVCLAVLRVELARECLRETHGSADQRLLAAIRQSDHFLHHLADIPALTRLIDHEHDRSRTLPPLRHNRHSL
jgi:Fe-S-cluster containining protein